VINKHHLDKRADKLAVATSDPDDQLMSTRDVALWLEVSDQFLEIGRHKGYGPRFIRLGPRRIRYCRSDVLAWLRTRTHKSTAEYAAGGAR
jgi:predicted DNA-binding transcriptional regulator AlpA